MRVRCDTWNSTELKGKGSFFLYSGTSLLKSRTGLGNSDLNGEVTLLQGVICTVEYDLGLSQGDRTLINMFIVRAL